MSNKKDQLSNKLANAIISDDASNVGDFIKNEVIIPALKRGCIGIFDIIGETIKSGAKMIFLGESAAKASPKTINGRTSYDAFYGTRSTSTGKGKRPPTYDEVTFSTRDKAENALSTMREEIERYGKVRLTRFYNLADISINSNYTYENYGWRDLSNVTVIPTVGGEYMLTMPRVELL